MTTTSDIRFDDGGAYEQFMGIWSRSVGERFLTWLAPAHHAAWVDIGCGNGAFTRLIVGSCAPSSVVGVDPSPEQLAFARAVPALRDVRFDTGDAMALPLADASVDVAVMPLVLFFVPDPVRGVAEMCRVVRPGGTVCGYLWDMPGGGFPYAMVADAMQALGLTVLAAPSADVSRREEMDRLWRDAGLRGVDTTVITVERVYTSVDEFWEIARTGPSTRGSLGEHDAVVRAAVLPQLDVRADGRVHVTAWAHAVRGTV